MVELSVYVESGKDTSYDSIRMSVHMDTKIKEMKHELYRAHLFPVNIQHWIIQGQLRTDEDTIQLCNIAPDTADPVRVCVYLTSKEEILNFETLVRVLDRAHIRQGTLEESILHWKCNVCTSLNEPTRPGCMVCSSDRPDDYKVPDNYVPTPAESRRLGVPT